MFSFSLSVFFSSYLGQMLRFRRQIRTTIDLRFENSNARRRKTDERHDRRTVFERTTAMKILSYSILVTRCLADAIPAFRTTRRAEKANSRLNFSKSIIIQWLVPDVRFDEIIAVSGEKLLATLLSTTHCESRPSFSTLRGKRKKKENDRSWILEHN